MLLFAAAPTPAWGAPAAAPAPVPVPGQPQGWGGAAAPPPTWGSPASSGQAPAPGQPPTQPAGQWAAPPAQPPAQSGWAPGPSGPGGPPPAGWAPAPASSGNGCLKACLIVGIVMVVIAVIGVIGISIVGMRFAEDMGVNPDGSFDSCELVNADDVRAIIGPAEVLPMGGLVDSTIGQLLDQRILGDAPDCWIIAESENSVTGRLARLDGGDASGDFARYRQAAQDGGYFAGAVSGVGEEAFCTSATEAMSFGVLVRSGGRLAYVSLIDPAAMQSSEFEFNEDGMMISPKTCAVAGQIAQAMLR